MSNFRLKSKQDIEDFLTGVAFFGTGGGGDVKTGRGSLNECLDLGLDMAVLDPSDIRDDGLYCSPCFVGSIAPKTPEVLAEMDFNGYIKPKYPIDDMLIEAVRRMEKHIGRKIDGLMVVEMGGSNSACCMAAAYKMGLPVIDGDPAGRAFPEATNSILSVRGFESLPAVFVDMWGSSVILTEVSHTKASERIGKFLSQAAYGSMAEAGRPHTGADLRGVLVNNSLTRAYTVGGAINRAVEAGADPLMAAAAAANGTIAARGILHSLEPVDADGYYAGTYCIRGEGPFAGRDYKIWFKNENHILWADGVPHTTSPDLISLINLKTGQPLLNTYLENDLPVGVVISRAYETYRAPEAIAAFGPRYFGFDFDYVPYGTVSI